MIDSVLIANRGEIARRILRTAKRLGVRTIAVHSDIDSAMPFVREADEAICIGAAPAGESYLAQGNCSRSQATGAAAIHPGYGSCRRNAEFAGAVVDAGLVWIVRASGGDPRHGAKGYRQKSCSPLAYRDPGS